MEAFNKKQQVLVLSVVYPGCMRYVPIFVVMALALVLGSSGSSATAGWPPAPTNLECIPSQTSIACAWGPTIPGPMKVVSETANSVTIEWGASEDSRGGIASYEVIQDGKVVQSAYVPTSFRFQVQKKDQSTTICVKAKNVRGQVGPQRCTTFTRGTPA